MLDSSLKNRFDQPLTSKLLIVINKKSVPLITASESFYKKNITTPLNTSRQKGSLEIGKSENFRKFLPAGENIFPDTQ